MQAKHWVGQLELTNTPEACEVFERIVRPEKSQGWTFQDVTQPPGFQACFSRKWISIKPPRETYPSALFRHGQIVDQREKTKQKTTPQRAVSVATENKEQRSPSRKQN